MSAICQLITIVSCFEASNNNKLRLWCLMPLSTIFQFCMAVGFTTTYAISAHHHKRCEFEFHSWGGILNTTLCDKVCQ
jgi:hypothetical protein